MQNRLDYSAFSCGIVRYGKVSKASNTTRLRKKDGLASRPRQSGKTTLAKELAKEFSSSIYLSYDRLEDRNMILKETWLP